MRKISLIVTGVCVSFFALSGCTSPAAKRMETYAHCHSEMSLARNIALHTSLTEEDGPLIDVAKEELPNDLQGASNHELANAFDTVGLTTLGIANFNGFAVPPGVSADLAGTMGLLGGLFTPGRAPHPALRHQVLAWMPKEQANSGLEAGKKLKEMVKAAFIASLPEGYSYSERVETVVPTFGKPFDKVYPTLTGPSCPSADGLECRVWYAFGEQPYERSAPEWASTHGQQTYVWHNWKDGSQLPDHRESASATFIVQYARPDRDYGLKHNDWLYTHGHALLEKMSAKLPEWIYLYAPPSEGNPYPVIFNKGEPLLFIH